MREAAALPFCSRSTAASASSCAPGFRRFIDFRFSPLQPPDTVIRAGPAGILSPHRPHTSVACPLSRTSNLSVRSSGRPPPAFLWALSRRPEDGDGGSPRPYLRRLLSLGLGYGLKRSCNPIGREGPAGAWGTRQWQEDKGLGDSQKSWVTCQGFMETSQRLGGVNTERLGALHFIHLFIYLCV